MSAINNIFDRIQKLTHEEGQTDFVSVLLNAVIKNEPHQAESNVDYQVLKNFLLKIFKEIDDLSAEIKKDETILISVRNQKLLRTCFQLVASLGFFPSLIPGLGINLNKRSAFAGALSPITLTDEQKYELLVACTDFIKRCYEIPVLKNIILTFHMSDYLAALIQLSFAPLKKPGTYQNFTMTQEMYDRLNSERQKYVQVYEHLVANCFQPILMKELLVLQSVTDPSPPMFVKRVVAKEMSRRLLAPGGLLSLIRCFIESYNIDTGFEWKKINMICKIVSAKHGTESEDNYLKNICSQLMQILTQNNTHYLATAVACVIALGEKYPQVKHVQLLMKEIFQAFDYKHLLSKSDLPGTVILSPQEVEHKVNVLHACVCTSRLECPMTLIIPNLSILFLLGIKCTKNEELKIKIKEIVLKCLEQLNKNKISSMVKKFLFGDASLSKVTVDEFEAGLTIKCVSFKTEHSISEARLYFLSLFKVAVDSDFVQNVFEASLHILVELSKKRKTKSKNDMLLSEDDEFKLDDTDEQYANILQLLSEISTSPKVVSSLKQNPSIVVEFIEYFIINNDENSNEECTTVALVLLNTILSNTEKESKLQERLNVLVPVLKKMSKSEFEFNNILCEEALSLISSNNPRRAETACDKAISNAFDNLLPVRAHGIIELTKLIDAKDPETLSRKHYIFCLFQEQLKDTDSYVYLAAINGIASLGTHCTEDVLQVLCKEFLQLTSELKSIETKDDQNKTAEMRMKIGDVIVKVTKRLGEMAAAYKTILLNTMLCGCRDEDPLIRTSALSNLAEIALVLHYKIGTIIYEVLLCIWSIIESDKAVECRRAAVMVISSLLKGLGKETLIQLKENLLPVYRTLKNLYRDENEDSVVRLHAQIALEELNDTVTQLMFPELKMEKQIFVLDKPEDVYK
ncbi:transport and Golgi organization protein 6 [Pectinophora gossypiella]|uniref:transport and Golgi organization protein 6 n=1 Tax=Pectinophora gossypiella TaxID=13191 RepID=UPI00214E41F5|nr:transport and Golgi organization protein 6 [Pectinophora gossypiella]